MEKYAQNRTCVLVCKKYTTFSTERIVALRSVNNIFPDSYDFAARLQMVTKTLALIYTMMILTWKTKKKVENLGSVDFKT
jgi:hypothetical protein